MKSDAAVDALRPVHGWEGLYSVTKDGRLYSHARMARVRSGGERQHLGGFVKAGLDTHGYPRVTLSGNGVRAQFSLHRLVMLSWMPHPNADSLDINHIDGHPTNCRLENLEWCTRSENHRHAWETGLRVQTEAMRINSIRMGLSNRLFTMEQAQDVRRKAASGIPKSHIAAALGVSRAAIHKILNGKSYQPNGEEHAI